MSRRDTIIVAVLVNAGLLLVLFATATHSTEKKERNRVELAKELPAKKKKIETPILEEEDFFDDFLTTTLDNQREEIALEPIEPKPVIKEVPPAVTELENCVRITVKSGDFLEKIAKAHHTTVAAIMKANHLNSTNLKVGQVLVIPLQEKSVETPESEGEYYVVKEGDSPWLIASKNRVRLEDLLRINGLDEQKARRLRPGDRLKIR